VEKEHAEIVLPIHAADKELSLPIHTLPEYPFYSF